MNDRKLFKYLLILLALPVGLAFFGNDRFRYPCQDPSNWEKDFCKKPICDVTRTCPEHVFKGQRDPRMGMQPDATNNQTTQQCVPQGVSCGK